MNPRYPEIALRAGHRCEYWRAPEAVFNFRFEVEHVLPLAIDGPTSASILALACRSCNMWKGSWTDGLDVQNHALVRLFHPREDRWDDLFSSTPRPAGSKGVRRRDAQP